MRPWLGFMPTNPANDAGIRVEPPPSDAVDTGTNPAAMGYAVKTQPSLDNNTVDLDRERANSVDNAVRYEATLRFINGSSKTMLSAIQGQ